MRKHLLASGLIFLLGFLIYFNSLNNDFQFDDYRLMEGIKLTRQAKDLLSLHLASRMVTNLTFFLNYRLHGFILPGYHLVNIFIHILSAILIYWIVFLLTADYPPQGVGGPASRVAGTDKTADVRRENLTQITADENRVTISPFHHFTIPLFTALLFLVHPLCTEPINYIIARYALLATMFSFFSLLFFILSLRCSGACPPSLGRRGLQTACSGWLQPSNKRWNAKAFLYILGSVLSFLAAGYSKEIGFYYALAMIFVYVAIFTNLLGKIRKKGLLFLIILLAGMSLFYFAGGFQRLETGELSFGRYFLTENKVFLSYLRLMIFPLYGLNVDHHHLWAKNLFEFSTLLTVIFNLFCLSLGFYFFWKRDSFFKQMVRFSIFWLYFLLLPYFFLVSEELMVEYRAYPAIFGFVLFTVCSLEKFVKYRKLKLFIFSGIILTFSVATFLRNYDWKNPITLWQDAAKKSPNKARVLTNLGNAYTLMGNIDLAIEKYQQSIRMNPFASETHTNLATAYRRKGKLDLAIETYKKALELDRQGEKKPKIYSNLGDVYFDKGMLEEAMESYENALKLNPSAYDVYWRRGILYYQKGLFDSAIEEFKKAVTVYPDYPLGYNSLGIIHDLKGEHRLAIEYYKKAIVLMPDYAEAYYNLGISYENLGELDEAVKTYQIALGLNPYYLKAYNNLGNVYYKKGEYEKAIQQYEKALKFDPNFKEAKNNLKEVEKLLEKSR